MASAWNSLTKLPAVKRSRTARCAPPFGWCNKSLGCTICSMSSASNSQEPPFKIAVIALGSNVGDSQKNILQAMGTLLKISSGFVCRSSLWRSTPVDCPPGSPDFINAVVGISVKADETPETMLARLQKIEQELGR